MRTFGSFGLHKILCLGVVGSGASAFCGPPFPTPALEVRMVTPRPAYEPGPVRLDPSADELTLDLYVQARIINDPGATGITAFDAALRTSDGRPEDLDVPTLTIAELLGIDPTSATNVPSPGGDCGPLGPYRASMPVSCEGPTYEDGALAFVLIDLDSEGNGEGIHGAWSDTFKVGWSTDDPTPRTVTLTLGSSSFGYQSDRGLQQAFHETSATFAITIGNPCIADYDGDGQIRILDVLEFLDDWLVGDADLDGDGRTSVLDLLVFLDALDNGC